MRKNFFDCEKTSQSQKGVQNMGTLRYLIFYMGLNVWIWMMEGNPFLSLLGWVGPESLDFFGPKWHSLRVLPFKGPEVSTFRAHPFKRPSLWISPYPNPYVLSHINNTYIITITVMFLCCKCGGTLWNHPLKITKWGHFKDSKWSRHKVETFGGALDFFGTKMALPVRFCSRDHFEPLKFCKGF